ncbi:hypothetical protein [Nocardia sp. BMG51109]|uniref:hypothetical protein n=1 Tax=Nocardia sp. BMG51109 TaxID=1056816 RepID=UPI0012EC6C92|nr:hypothetical protein [Nocardia sp. BMG51109]
MEPDATTQGRLAIRCIRPDLTGARDRDEQQMTDTGIRLGYAVDDTVIALDPTWEAPLVTILRELRRTGADAVIVPGLSHIDGIDEVIRLRAKIVTVAGGGLVFDRLNPAVEVIGLGLTTSGGAA